MPAAGCRVPAGRGGKGESVTVKLRAIPAVLFLLTMFVATHAAPASVPIPVFPAAEETGIAAGSGDPVRKGASDPKWPGDTTIAATIGILFAVAVAGWCHLARRWLRRRRLVRARADFSAFVSELRLRALAGKVDQLLEYEPGGRRFHQRADIPGPSVRKYHRLPVEPVTLSFSETGVSGPRCGFRLPAGTVFDDEVTVDPGEHAEDSIQPGAITGNHRLQFPTPAESAGPSDDRAESESDSFRRVRFCSDGRMIGAVPLVELRSGSGTVEQV